MDIITDDRRNRLYRHTSSQARRAEERNPPAIGPVARLRQKHRDEKLDLAEKHRKAKVTLSENQTRRRNENHGVRNGADAPHEMKTQEIKERKALEARIERENQVMADRHRRELEPVLVKHGAK